MVSIDIPSSVTSIGNYAFKCCISLGSLSIPDSVTFIGHSAFYKCTSLTSVTIPSKLTFVAENAFADCSSLASVTIPSSVTTIDAHAFNKCASLKEFVSLAVNPPSLDWEPFKNPISSVLQVPRGSLERYKASDWNKYFEGRIIEMEE